MPHRLRYAICNEVFENRPFADACRAIRRAGYGGIEIAPFTLAAYPSTLSPARRRQCSDIINSEGLQFVGLHWLMVSPKGLHVSTPDAGLRSRSWEHIRHLIDLCADLGPDGILVFGSPQQRGTTGGIGRADATRHFVAGLAAVAPHAGERGVTILMEALPLGQCDVVTSLDEAATLVREIDHPAIRTMFDCHNAIDEPEPHAALVDRHYDLIRHIHVNELDGRHPGTGSYDFRALFDVLRRREYGGWVSLEAFDFAPGAEIIARESLAFLEKQ
jgi:D-psicose/D-tagatose/L-ribulose 3-epimerase